MKTKFLALILAVAMLFSVCLTGCSGLSSIAKVNGEDVPVGWYVANAVYTAAQMEQSYGENYYLAFLKLANNTDPSRTNAQVLDDAAKAAFEQTYTYKLMIDEYGLEMDGLATEAFEAEYNFLKSTFFMDEDYNRFLKLSKLSEEEYKEIYKATSYYPDMLYDYYFDEQVGIDPLTDAKVRAFFDEYTEYCMKHIMFAFATTDAEGNALDDAAIKQNKAEAKKEAEETLKKLQSGELEFDSAMNSLTDDASYSSYPDGYAWKEGDGMLPDVFTTAAKEMDFGEMKLYEGENGYHIMCEIDPDDYYETHYLVYETAYTQNYIQEKVSEYKQNKVLIEYNEAALNKYSFLKLGSVNITLLSLSEEDMQAAAQATFDKLDEVD